MGKIKALLDTNIVIDFLNQREPFYEQARLLMIAGRVGEFDLWILSSQVTDLIYIPTPHPHAICRRENCHQRDEPP